ncbi:MAG: geranylgeranylglycerol-phosphate geranylgeranyltransferase [Bacteroidetes bacterium]|nr:geranylgeranylglycerol-phosphate geranylgeranyltransferase [Bacteroidota bacterium]MBK8413450.1 geranylgeranylglycerol-phosphate geranylgeranyltransferase [Bacteroidota bacterium]MBK8876757.1 geranylgeranylglycerol-phosphate geranylgeranyltransferase [Bacteroidota bacterium]MBK9046357.1 geranylgeranylglycerol-phosphate geranylgeranyltransferase [Bacteroidota bacterium]MBK9424947.1 geranylgeranylglycerol-phosphate geranylgeranyltransferase [Bacteroidota bacterium]
MKIVSEINSIAKLTRAGNLVIIALSLFLVRYLVVKPFLFLDNTESSISDFQFSLLTLAVVLIAAGGYVINDIFDVQIDAINKPGKNLVGSYYSKKTARILYAALTIGGIATAIVFGEGTGIKYSILIIAFSAGLLYFYSSSYKKMLLAGNLTISFLTGLNIFISILFDDQSLHNESVLTIVTAFTIFAFLMTLGREIIKDCEDAQGDENFGASTLPVVAGLKTGRITASLVFSVVLGLLIWIQVSVKQWEDIISFGYVVIVIQLPLLYLIAASALSKSASSDHKCSNIAKFIMITGLLAMVIFNISFN